MAGLRGSIGLLLVGALGMGLGLAGAWIFLANRGLVRWIGAVLVLLGPLTVAVLYMRANLAWVVVVFVLLSVACRWESRLALVVAQGLAWLFVGLCFLSSASDGLFVMPGAAVLLCGALLLEPRQARCA